MQLRGTRMNRMSCNVEYFKRKMAESISERFSKSADWKQGFARRSWNRFRALQTCLTELDKRVDSRGPKLAYSGLTTWRRWPTCSGEGGRGAEERGPDPYRSMGSLTLAHKRVRDRPWPPHCLPVMRDIVTGHRKSNGWTVLSAKKSKAISRDENVIEDKLHQCSSDFKQYFYFRYCYANLNQSNQFFRSVLLNQFMYIWTDVTQSKR